MYRKEKERERQREREKKGVDTSKDKEEVGALDRGGMAGERGETGCGTAIIVAFPTDKVTARGNTSYFLPLTGRVLREKKANNSHRAPPSPSRRSATCIDGRASQTRPGLHRRPLPPLSPLPPPLICAGGIGYARVCSWDRPVKPGY